MAVNVFPLFINSDVNAMQSYAHWTQHDDKNITACIIN